MSGELTKCQAIETVTVRRPGLWRRLSSWVSSIRNTVDIFRNDLGNSL